MEFDEDLDPAWSLMGIWIQQEFDGYPDPAWSLMSVRIQLGVQRLGFNSWNRIRICVLQGPKSGSGSSQKVFFLLPNMQWIIAGNSKVIVTDIENHQIGIGSYN